LTRFFIVDVFAEERYAGNPLAVVVGSADLPEPSLQRIARETNFSETSFVPTDRPLAGGFDARIFTPATEIPFAGHPTLGTAWVIRNEWPATGRDEVVLRLGVGPIRVRFDREGVGWLRPNPPQLREVVAAEAVAAVLSLDPEDLDLRFPVQHLSTGVSQTFVPLRTLDALRRARFDLARYRAGKHRFPSAMFLFAPETYDAGNHFCARMFAEEFGVPEDPATGSANAALAAYLSQYRVLGDERVEARVEQGMEIGRPSLLRLRAASPTEVEVGGRVFLVARGELV
jgi:trans-2,3-dihydro-3-hydroxyanthranilate isomerase